MSTAVVVRLEFESQLSHENVGLEGDTEEGMRRALLAVGLTLALASSAMAACPCVRYHERVAVDRYAVRMGHFYVASCTWKPHDRLVCVLERFEVGFSYAFGSRLIVCRAKVAASVTRSNRVRVTPFASGVICS